MNDVLPTQPLFAPHLLPNHRLSPTRSISSPNAMSTSTRKRKANEDPVDQDERMSSSPSPSFAQRSLPPPSRNIKRLRSNITGRALPLPRLLETLGAEEMRLILRGICERHPEVAAEVVNTAPRPSVESALAVLDQYEANMRSAFPFGNRVSSDYAYNRVRQPLGELLDALRDFTPHFLPPHETTPATSLSYLDQATNVIHRLQEWDTYQNNRHKVEAYEEISRAWALVIREAAKRGGGIQLQYGGWDQKLAKHNELSGGKMNDAVEEMRSSVGWMGETSAPAAMGPGMNMTDREHIRQQLLDGTYGLNTVQVGPW